jgi:hypothetical protein
MKQFKFFHKNDDPTVAQLLNYNRRIRCAYINMLNLVEGSDEHTAVVYINETTSDWINEGQLTTYGEIRSYYQVSFENMSVNIYGTVITDAEHEFLIRDQTIEELLVEVSELINRGGNTGTASYIRIDNPGE